MVWTLKKRTLYSHHLLWARQDRFAHTATSRGNSGALAVRGCVTVAPFTPSQLLLLHQTCTGRGADIHSHTVGSSRAPCRAALSCVHAAAIRPLCVPIHAHNNNLACSHSPSPVRLTKPCIGLTAHGSPTCGKTSAWTCAATAQHHSMV